MQIRHDFFPYERKIHPHQLLFYDLADDLHDTVRTFFFLSLPRWHDKNSLPRPSIRHSTEIIPKLDPLTRQAAIDSYADALRVVFICQAAINLCGLLACLPIQENALPWVLSNCISNFQKSYVRLPSWTSRSAPLRRIPENEESRGH